MYYDNDNMRLFWEYIAKRHTIYVLKEEQRRPPPWTDDPLLRQFKYTNVHRELDRGTRFVYNYIYPEFGKDVSVTDIVFNVLAYRLFNKIETYMHHGFIKTEKYDQYKFDKLLHKYAIENPGISVFTNAFVVSGYSLTELAGLDKISRLAIIFGWLIEQLNRDSIRGNYAETIVSGTFEECYKLIRGLTGFGPFLGYQVAVDLSYWDHTAFGEDDFVVMGPGAKRGINWLMELEENGKLNYEECCFWLRDHQFEFWKDYDINYLDIFSSRPIPYLTVMSLENDLCEFQKYMKAYTGQGRPRNRYDVYHGEARIKQYDKKEDWNRNILNIYNKPCNSAKYWELSGKQL